MNKNILIIFIVIIIVLPSSLCINAENLETSKMQTLSESGIKERIFERINEIRERNGLSPLEWNETLEKAAQMHAEDMAKRNYFSHESPEGETFKDRLAKVGYKPKSISDGKSETIVIGGENLFLYGGEGSVEEIVNEAVNGWMNSKGHRDNILRKEFTLTGIGVAFAHNCTYEGQSFEFCIYIVQMFG
ncbi:hypothetical protein PAP_04600 [Palaeococcus pacificus DY20341]|uniref:SCP domain-containing protein n=1 Tax=Palaeococcus pacificus DY20341 TaxID=1343739 RepID=A0A075LT79_9EURY|nr:CAP domain-containing protein [Palaeococcus pacificus]AIF69331.1 hypothetical protein PAP_04600 [Palaeococcus pacificus DY20341]